MSRKGAKITLCYFQRRTIILTLILMMTTKRMVNVKEVISTGRESATNALQGSLPSALGPATRTVSVRTASEAVIVCRKKRANLSVHLILPALLIIKYRNYVRFSISL